ncbi:sigma factor-like helix-turn-helix DNA-binding protein [Elusimicrobiota bacterium]
MGHAREKEPCPGLPGLIQALTRASRRWGASFRVNPEATEKDWRSALGRIEDRRRRILELRFGLGGSPPMTLKQVGELFSLTRERIRQIQDSALWRLKRVGSEMGLLRKGLQK